MSRAARRFGRPISAVPRRVRAGLKACTTLALLICAVSADAASLFDPIYRFRVLPTEHFIIYFHQGEERVAARLASIAEETWTALERPLGTKRASPTRPRCPSRTRRRRLHPALPPASWGAIFNRERRPARIATDPGDAGEAPAPDRRGKKQAERGDGQAYSIPAMT